MKTIKDSLINIRRYPYQSMLAVFMISVTFFVGYLFSLALIGGEKALQFFESSPQIIAFFELEAETNDINKVALEMKSKDYVKDVQVVSKEEALDIYRSDYKDSPLLLELVTADILPSSIEISASRVEDLPKIKADLEKYKIIEDISFQQDIIDSLSKWINSIRLVGLFSTAIFGTMSFFVMVIIIGMKVASKRTTITIMKIIGATNFYIISPFIYEGMFYGFFGSIIGWTGMYGLLLYLTPWINNFLNPIITLPIPNEFFLWQIGIGTLGAIILGSMASIVAAKKMIKK